MLSQTALLKAIKYCGSKQKKLADLIGEDPDKISYWLNRAKQVPFHQAIAIESATEGLVSRYDLAPYARFHNKKNRSEALPPTSSQTTISERVAMGVAFEKSLGNRRGVRNDLWNKVQANGTKNEDQTENQRRRKCAQVNGKTSTLVAKQVGFTSRDTYLRAKKVIQRGIFKLVQAMDKHSISISNASAIADFPPDEQALLLLKNKKEIGAILREKQKNKIKGSTSLLVSKDMEKQTDYFLNVFKNSALIDAEKTYQLPLRLPLLGLFIYCDCKGYFIWNPEELKNKLLPYLELDFGKVLEILISLRCIRKIQGEGKIVGQLIITEFY